jgi:CRISPR-associated protein Csh2
MASIIQHRTELLFLFEAEYTNPNGDPLNENRPRFDPEESKALVSDVRLKRTIRDYWHDYKGYDGTNDKDIFVKETKYPEADKKYVNTGKRRVDFFKKDDKSSKNDLKKNILSQCIDIRVFGGVLPMKEDSITLTGPVQFNIGKSINKTEIITEQGTGAFASVDNKAQATFRTEYKLPYALVGFNGIINEKSAQNSRMTDEDQKMLLEGIWEGTKQLISRSKFGQAPVLLIAVTYKEPFYIGSLRQRLKLDCENDLKIRNINDYKLDMTDLWTSLKKYAEKIDSIEIMVDERLQMTYDEKPFLLKNGKIQPNELG